MSSNNPVMVDDSTNPNVPVAQAEPKLETAIKDLPEPKQNEIRQSIQETFMGFIERSSAGPKMDPETAKILVASADRDNDHKFQFLSQKQGDSARQNEREHNLEVQRHIDRMKLARPILYVSLALIAGCTVSGIYLSATGHDALGASILSGIFGAVFGYLGGLGTANFFKNK
jgi:hypothetical protein